MNYKTQFHLDSYIQNLMSKMEFQKASPEVQEEMYDVMQRQVLYRMMKALSMNLDTEATATFAIEAQKPENQIVDVVNKILETNETARRAVMDELDRFEQETLAAFERFGK